MFTFVLTLHVLAAVFVIGPLVGASTTAVRGVRTANGAELDYATRTTRVYTFASFVVIIFGFGLLGMQDEPRYKFNQPWIYLSILFWLLACAVSFAVLIPGLEKASEAAKTEQPLDRFRARIAASGGIIGLLFAAVVVLMVTRPGAGS